MKKRLLFGLLMIMVSSFGFAQQTTLEAMRVIASDSLRLKTDWITSIVKDTALTGASIKNIPATDAVVKYIANRLVFLVKYGDTAALLAGYARETRFLDSLVAVQARIQTKLTKSDADTYYPAIQRLIDSAAALQGRIQTKLTKSDADTYYPAIQRLIDSATALQGRIQTKITKADADTYYPAIQRLIDSSTAIQARIQEKQPLLGYTAENVANKATDFSTLNNTLYPTTQAVSTYTQSALTGVVKDMGNYDASGNAYPSSGGSGTSGAIKKGDMWYISVAGTLGGTAVSAGDWIRALTDAPGSTSSNWAIAKGNFGFTPANAARTLTINSTTYDLSANRTWSVGTVTSVGLSVPTGLSVTSGSPVTGSGTIAIGLQSGYSIPTTASQTNWDAGYNDKIASITFSSSAITLTQQDGGTVTSGVPTFNQNTTGSSGSVANSVTFNNGGSGDASGTTFNGSTARTISYNTVGAASASGSGASGTWAINVTGTAASETLATVTGRGATTSTAVNFQNNVTIGGDLFLPANKNIYTNTSYRIASWNTSGVLYLGDIDNGYTNVVVRQAGAAALTFSSGQKATFANSVAINETVSDTKLRVTQTTGGEWTAIFKNYTSSAYGVSIDNSSATTSTSLPAFQIYTPSGTGLYFGNNGRLGVGTFSPSYPLEVQGVSGDWSARIKSGSTTGSSYGLIIDAGTNANDNPLYIRNYNGSQVFLNMIGNGATTLTSTTASPFSITSTDANSNYTPWRYNTSTIAGYVGTAYGLITGGPTGFAIRSEGDLYLASNGGTVALSFNTSQAATFTALVTATTGFNTGASTWKFGGVPYNGVDYSFNGTSKILTVNIAGTNYYFTANTSIMPN